MAEPDLTMLQKMVRDLQTKVATDSAPLKSGDGGGTYDGMDGWQSSVEARLSEIKTDVRGLRDEARGDFRLLFGAIIAAALGLGTLMLGLAGLMAKGFHWF